MYGFPVTIYVLTTVFGLKIPWLQPSGHLWATLLGFGYLGDVIEMLIGFTFVIVGLPLSFDRGVARDLQGSATESIGDGSALRCSPASAV